VDASYQEHDLRERHSENMVISNRLNGKHLFFDRLEFDWSGSYSATTNNRPFVNTMRFREQGAFNPSSELSYDDIVNPPKTNVDATFLKEAYFDNYHTKDNNYTVSANLKLPFSMGNQVMGYVKAGGKYRHKSRVNDIGRIRTTGFVGQEIISDGTEQAEWDVDYINNFILMSNFRGDYYADDFGRFLDGQYYMGPGPELVNGPLLDAGKVDDFRNNYDDYYSVDASKDLGDYEAGEAITAGYGMASLNFYKRIDLIAGLRYEETRNSYRSIFGTPQVDEDGNVTNTTGLVDTVGNRVLDQWLPMVHLKVDLLDWANLRLAATKSLSRPNFFSLVPWENISTEGYAERGGFYKEIENIDYTLTSRVYDPDDPISGYYLTRPVNAEGVSTILGYEMDLQSNFRFLPSPFNGIVVSANYTHLTSETLYPISLIETETTFPYNSTVKDTVRSGSMPGQVDNLVNLSIGYERGGFSARVSMLYQGESLFVNEEPDMGRLAPSIGTTPDKDNYVGPSTRWDLVVKQKIKDFQVFLYVNNFTNVKEQNFLSGSVKRLMTSNFVYGMTIDVGVTYKF